MSIVIDDHTARQLARELSVLEDWLAHTPSAREDLAEFAFQRCYRPEAGVAALIRDLGETSTQLSHHPSSRALRGEGVSGGE